MTVCMAVSDGSKTILASDTRSINGNFTEEVPKWIVGDTLAVAIAGDYLSYNLIREHWEEFEQFPGMLEFPVQHFRQFVLGLFEKYQYKASEAKGSRAWGSEFILASAEAVVSFDETLCSITQPTNIPAMIGSGAPYAVGAFHAAKGSLKTRALTALRVTNEICSECSGEFLHVLRA